MLLKLLSTRRLAWLLVVLIPLTTIAPAELAAAQSTSPQPAAPAMRMRSWRQARLIRTIAEPNGQWGSPGLMAVSPDRRLVAGVVGENSNIVRVWNARTGQTRYTLNGHTEFLSAIAFSPDGRLLATGDYNIQSRLMTVRLWDMQTGRRVRTLIRSNTPKFYNGAFYHRSILAFSPDGRTLYSAASNPIIQVWDVSRETLDAAPRGTLVRSLVTYPEAMRSIRVSPDGQILATTHVDGTLSLYNLQTGESARFDTATDAFEVAFTPDGQTVTGMFENRPSYDVPGERLIQSWNVATGAVVRSIRGFSDQSWIVFSPDGKNFAVTTYGRDAIDLYEFTVGATPTQVQTFAGRTSTLDFSSDGRMLAAMTPEGVKIWR